jgi:hypothetical protein
MMIAAFTVSKNSLGYPDFPNKLYGGKPAMRPETEARRRLAAKRG